VKVLGDGELVEQVVLLEDEPDVLTGELLPAPEGPMMVTNSPGATSRVMRRRT
jgi:hypothetical protein